MFEAGCAWVTKAYLRALRAGPLPDQIPALFASALDRLYDDLSDMGDGCHITGGHAVDLGWPPAMAWDDWPGMLHWIDDPQAPESQWNYRAHARATDLVEVAPEIISVSPGTPPVVIALQLGITRADLDNLLSRYPTRQVAP